MRQQQRMVLTGLGHLLLSLGHVFTRLGHGFPSLRRLLPKRRMGNMKLVRFSTLLG
jgi:hypothetical protein